MTVELIVIFTWVLLFAIFIGSIASSIEGINKTLDKIRIQMENKK